MTMEGGNLAARKILENGAKRPTAVYFPIYLMAVAALPVFHLAGIKIPDMLEIMTFGNQEIVKYTVPSLSTVDLPIEDMAGACVRLVKGMLTGIEQSSRSILFETPFIFRESCGGFLHEL
jgi:DNA-binding LacI/PurR family transcriptional regulator